MSSRRTDRRALAADALAMAIRVRQDAGLGLDGPIDMYGLCDHLRVPFRFVDVNMEGMYQRTPTPYIVLSALRPLARRVFNCAHELGHHAFGHGLTVDALVQEHMVSTRQRGHVGYYGPPKSPDEFLVDAFAGFLLMPSLALRKAYATRGIRPDMAAPEQHFAVACSFGVGYATLVSHLAFGAKQITAQRAGELLRVPVAKIRRAMIGQVAPVQRLIVADAHWQLPTVDTEVGTHLLLPPGAQLGGDHLVNVANTAAGRLVLATRPGITRVLAVDGRWAAFVRVSRYQYVGLGRYRHLDAPAEDPDDEAGDTAACAAQEAVPAGEPAEGDYDD